MHKRARALFPVSLLSAAVFNAVPAIAQETNLALEEVVVTAQRREQSIQDVPISVTAFTGADLQQRNITNAVDYLKITPGVSFTEDGQTGSRGMGIAVRGVNSLVTGENAFVNSIGIYHDDFSVASVPNNVANPNLADMDRVEVLRGPQGTFFGRNAVGGACNVTLQYRGAAECAHADGYILDALLTTLGGDHHLFQGQVSFLRDCRYRVEYGSGKEGDGK